MPKGGVPPKVRKRLERDFEAKRQRQRQRATTDRRGETPSRDAP
jgi:hypothetical protein